MGADWWTDSDEQLEGVTPPAPPSPFQGRRKEMGALDGALGPACRLAVLAIQDRPGTGRSALVWECVRRSRRFPGGVLWWQRDIDGEHLGVGLLRMAGQLDVEPGEAPALGELVEAVATKAREHAEAAGAVLVVLDGVQAADLGTVDRFAKALGPVGVVLAAESPDAVPAGFQAVTVGPLTAVDGLALLRRASGASLPQNVAVAVLDVFDGLPLGIELAAARLRGLPGADPATLGDLADPGSPEATALARAPGGAAARAWLALYQSMPARVQRVVRWCAALGRPMIDARLLAGVVGGDIHEVREDLATAVELGVLRSGEPLADARVPPLFGVWLRALLASAGEEGEARARHLDELVRAVAGRGTAGPASVGEIVQALEVAEGRSARDALLSLVPAVFDGWRVLLRAGLRDVVLRAADRALRLPGPRDARCQQVEAGVRSLRGQAEAAPAPVTPADDSAALESLRLSALEEASELSIQAEEAAVQAAVWVEGGRADASGQDAAGVRAALTALVDAGERAERAAARAVAGVDDIVGAPTVAGVRATLQQARDASQDAVEASVEAERAWASLQQAIAASRSEHARVDALLAEATQECDVAARVLDDTRERVREHHGQLPEPMPATLQEAWSGVARAMAQAIAAARDARGLVEGATRTPDRARQVLVLVREHRVAVEAACARALDVAADTARVARHAKEQRGAADEVRQHARQAQEAAARFRGVADKLDELLQGVDDDAARRLAQRAQVMREEVDRELATAVDGPSRVRQAGEAHRGRLAEATGLAARMIAAHAVEIVAMLTDAERVAAESRQARPEAQRRPGVERLRRLEGRAAEIGEAATRLPALKDVIDRRVRQQIGEAHDAVAQMQRALEPARAALREAAEGRSRADAFRLASAAEDMMVEAEQAIARVTQGIAARAAADADRIVANVRTLAGQAESAVVRAEHALGTVRQTLVPMDAPASREIAARAVDGVDRARFAAGLARDAATKIDPTTPREDLQRMLGSTESTVRQALDAAAEVEQLVERARAVLAAWLEERRQAETTARTLEQRASRVATMLADLEQTVADVRAATSSPPSEGARIGVQDASGALEAARHAASRAQAAVRGLRDPEGMLNAIADAETMLRSFDEAAFAVDEALRAAREAHANAVALRARVVELRQRVRLLVDEARPILAAATSVVTEGLDGIEIVGAGPAASQRDAARAGLEQAEAALARLHALHDEMTASDDAEVVQRAHGEAEDVAEDIAGRCEAARVAMAEATRLAEEERQRRQAEAERVLAEVGGRVKAARAVIASLRGGADLPVVVRGAPWAAVPERDVVASQAQALDAARASLIEACDHAEAVATTAADHQDPEAAWRAAVALDDAVRAAGEAERACAEARDVVAAAIAAWDEATRARIVEAWWGTPPAPPPALPVDAAITAELDGFGEVGAALAGWSAAINALAAHDAAGDALRHEIVEVSSLLAGDDPAGAARAWGDARPGLERAAEAAGAALVAAVEAASEAGAITLHEEVIGITDGAASRAVAGREAAQATLAAAERWHAAEIAGVREQVLRALSAVDDAVAGLAIPLPTPALPSTRAPTLALARARAAAVDDALAELDAMGSILASLHEDALDAALAAAGAGVDACGEVLDAEATLAARTLEEVHAAASGLEDEEEVADGLRRLRASVEAVEAARDAWAARGPTPAELDARRALLALTCGDAGRGLAAGVEVQRRRRDMDDAIGRVLRARHARARARAEAAHEVAIRHEDAVRARIGELSATLAPWLGDADVDAVSAALQADLDAAAQHRFACEAAARSVPLAGLLSDAEAGAEACADAAAALAALVDPVEARAAEVDAAVMAAEARRVAQVQHACDALGARLDVALEAVDEAVAAAHADAEGWTLPEVREAVGDVVALAHEAHDVAARARDILTRVATRDRLVDATADQTALADAVAQAETALELCVERHGVQRVWQDAHIGPQLDAFAEQVEQLARDADRAVQRAVAARTAGERRAAGWHDEALDAAVARLLEASIDCQRQYQRLFELRAGLHELEAFAPAREAITDAQQAAMGTAEAADATNIALDAVDERVEALERREALRREVLHVWRPRLDEAQVAFDEIELTLEAARSELEVETTEDVRAAWQETQAVAGAAAAGLAAAVAAYRAFDAETTTEGLELAAEQLREHVDTTMARCREAGNLLPEVLARQIRYAQGRRDLLESQMNVRVLVARIEQLRARIRRSVARSRRAAALVPSARSAWQAVHDAATVWESRTANVTELRAQVEATTEADTALALARQATDAYAAARDLASLILRDSTRAQALAQEATEGRFAATRADTDDLRAGAVDVLQQRFDLRKRTEGWARRATAWAGVWTEKAVRRAATAVLDAMKRIQEVDDALQREASRAVAAGDVRRPGATSVQASRHLELAREQLDRLQAATEEAVERMDALASEIRQAHAARVAARDAALQHREVARAATQRLSTGLGPSAARRVPLFERGLQVARLRGEKLAILGWLLDLSDLYVEVGRLESAGRLLVEARDMAAAFPSRAQARVSVRVARLARLSGDPAACVEACRAGIELLVDARDPELALELHAELGEAQLALGDVGSATDSLEQALEQAMITRDERLVAVARGRLARLARRRGDVDDALDQAVNAYDGFARVGDAGGRAAEAARMATLLRSRDPAEAVRLGQAAVAMAPPELLGGRAVARGVEAMAWLACERPRRALHVLDVAVGEADRDPAVEAWIELCRATAFDAVAQGRQALTPGLAWASSKEVRRRCRRRHPSRWAWDIQPSPHAVADRFGALARAAELSSVAGDGRGEGRRRLSLARAYEAAGYGEHALEEARAAEQCLADARAPELTEAAGVVDRLLATQRDADRAVFGDE